MNELSYRSQLPGIGGTLKESMDDFRVEEIPSLPEFSKEGKYAYFVLEKKGKATGEAIGAVAEAIGCPVSRFSAAGQKDRQASTSQVVSAFGIGKADLEKAHLPQSITLRFLGYSDFR
jgi:tRNA pseudouridine13 synthase